MIRFMITMCMLTASQTMEQSFIPQFVSTSAIPRLPVQPPGQVIVQFLPPLPRRFQNRPSFDQLLRNSGSDGNLPAARANQPRRELFIPQTTLGVENNVTNQPQPRITTESTSGNIAVQNNSDVYDKVDSEERPDFERGEVNMTSKVPPAIITRPDISTQKPLLPGNSTVGDNTNVSPPSLDQRANFDGDKCPTGYYRVNGSTECVQPD